MTINGQSASYSVRPPLPSYHVHPGEHLLMAVTVTVPGHLRIAALWLGISTGTWGNGPGGRPTGMKPVLAFSHQPLSTGVHTFRLRWRVPGGQPDGRLFLVSAWSSHQPPAGVAGAIAALAVH